MLYVYLKIAASVALAVVSFFVVRQLINEQPERITSGEVPIEIFLEDSSRVWLNKNSSVEYDYANKERSIKLQGEAFFEVKPDRLRPFTISADKSRIVVVGTSFMVYADPLKDINSVEVHEGVVEFSRRGNTSTPIRLTKNMRGLFDKNTGQLIKSNIPGGNITAILDRKIVFRATSMEEVVRVLTEYFDITITVTNPEILTCRFTSTFDDPTIQEVFEVLSVSLNLEVVTDGDKFSLQGGGCK